MQLSYSTQVIKKLNNKNPRLPDGQGTRNNVVRSIGIFSMSSLTPALKGANALNNASNFISCSISQTIVLCDK